MNKLILLFITSLIFSNTSFAETQLTLSPSLLHFDYSEFSTTDRLLDREKGWLPGIDLKLDHTIDIDWSLAIYGAYYTGTVDYAGETQSGIPISTNTNTELLRIGGQINRKLYKTIQLFVGAQAHQWNRDIQDNDIASGLYESYKWREYSIGLNSSIQKNEHDTLSVEVAYLFIRDATMYVDLSRIDAGSTTLDLTNGKGARLRISWDRQHTENIHYGVSLVLEGWEFGRSNTKPTRGGLSSYLVTEPRSETQHAQLQFNIKHSF